MQEINRGHIHTFFQGRGGKGNIYVWATGNGGLTDDDCNCDGYTTSIYTISVGCIGDHGLSAYYTELCSSTLGVTFNGGSHREKEENKMVSTLKKRLFVPSSEHSFISHRKITRRNKSLEREREREYVWYNSGSVCLTPPDVA